MADPVHFSRLKLLGESGQHYLGDHGPKESPSLRKGTGLHSFMLGNKHRIAVCPEGMIRNAKHKAYQAFIAENPGKEILNETEIASVRAMRSSLENHARAMELLAGVQEQTIAWRFMGRRCAGTPDSYLSHRVVELKALRTTNPIACVPFMRRLAYHAQVAWYSDGLERAGLAQPTEHYVVAVAQLPPHLVVVYRITPRALDIGRRMYRLWMEQLKQCELSGVWPGYSDCDVPFDIEEELEMDEEGLELEEIA